MNAPQNTVDESKLALLLNEIVRDMGAAIHAVLVVIGDRIGLYKAMTGAGPQTAAQIAARAGADERYTREWLNANAAGGWITYNAGDQTYELTPEQQFVLSTMDVPGAYQIVASCFRDAARLEQAFLSRTGFGWHEHDPGLFEGTERFFRPNYLAHLLTEWIPALDGVQERLSTGAKVADVGCGHGASTLILAQAFPNSRFFGFDYHDASIRRARQHAAEAGVDGNVHFEVAAAKSFPGEGYDLVTFFDCLHDMGDPAGAARHVLSTLAPGGTWMVVEPFAGDRVEDNLNPVGRIFYSASTVICTPASRAQEVGLALGAQAGEKRLREIVLEGGFRHFRRAAQTPFNLVFEARA
ncbi:MAG: class I SAM-dependent methyltransferase [Bryobacteraceae bacterium]|jgi:2-polyprenyl-3-methyl-5-hydroxy-6-metoxy-1,4-benzoquinol methylase